MSDLFATLFCMNITRTHNPAPSRSPLETPAKHPLMHLIKGAPLDLLQESLLETLWPTRCAVCDRQGTLLCDKCLRNLPYIDHWRTCKRCGAPHGNVQCSECNPVKLAQLGLRSIPFDSCVSAVALDSHSGRLVTAYKDQNEQRLASVLAYLIERVIPPDWVGSSLPQGVSFIPATNAAYLRRGFDHAQLLAQELAELLHLPCLYLFERPQHKDQRTLSRESRIKNTQSHFVMKEIPPPSVLLIDDVYTTGSTLMAASIALRDASVQTVRCATFARVW